MQIIKCVRFQEAGIQNPVGDFSVDASSEVLDHSATDSAIAVRITGGQMNDRKLVPLVWIVGLGSLDRLEYGYSGGPFVLLHQLGDVLVERELQVVLTVAHKKPIPNRIDIQDCSGSAGSTPNKSTPSARMPPVLLPARASENARHPAANTPARARLAT